MYAITNVVLAYPSVYPNKQTENMQQILTATVAETGSYNISILLRLERSPSIVVNYALICASTSAQDARWQCVCNYESARGREVDGNGTPCVTWTLALSLGVVSVLKELVWGSQEGSWPLQAFRNKLVTFWAILCFSQVSAGSDDLSTPEVPHCASWRRTVARPCLLC
jgi:hypothetical protein